GGVRGHGDAAARAPARPAARALALRLDPHRAHPKRAAPALDRALRDAGAAARGRRRLSLSGAGARRASGSGAGCVAAAARAGGAAPVRAVRVARLGRAMSHDWRTGRAVGAGGGAVVANNATAPTIASAKTRSLRRIPTSLYWQSIGKPDSR